MSTRPFLVVNGKRIPVRAGETLLEAALAGGVVIPHDCATGQCESCRVRIYDGTVDAAGTERGNTVLACLAKVRGDAVIEFDAVPEVVKRAGHVSSITMLSREIAEVSISLAHDFTYLPGQYVGCAFAGFPSRDYSPTLRNDGSGERNELILHIRLLPSGTVSSEIGRGIRVGHKVTVRGPFGSAFYRPGEGRLVLIAGGTGWAPIWSVARAARYREPSREMVLITGARDPDNLYMSEALDWLRSTGVTAVTATASGGTPVAGIASGRPTAHIPLLRQGDTVYAAGTPGMVAAVQMLAASVGAACHADPFVASSEKRTLKHRLMAYLRFGPRAGAAGNAAISTPS